MISYLFFVILSIPALFILKPFNLPGEFWLYISMLGVFDVFGNMFLVKSLKTIDLSVFGPLNSFKPVFAMIFGVFLLGEVPSTMGLIGVLVIISGSYFLNYNPNGNVFRWQISRGLLFRFLAIALTSIAAIFSKKTILLSSPLITLIYWSVIGWPISFLLVLKLNPLWKKEVRGLIHHKWHLIMLCLSFLALQFFTLLTFEKVFVAYSLALFQLSSLVSVFLGYHVFKEKDIKYRLIGSIIMVLGSVLILLFG